MQRLKLGVKQHVQNTYDDADPIFWLAHTGANPAVRGTDNAEHTRKNLNVQVRKRVNVNLVDEGVTQESLWM